MNRYVEKTMSANRGILTVPDGTIIVDSFVGRSHTVYYRCLVPLGGDDESADLQGA